MQPCVAAAVGGCNRSLQPQWVGLESCVFVYACVFAGAEQQADPKP